MNDWKVGDEIFFLNYPWYNDESSTGMLSDFYVRKAKVTQLYYGERWNKTEKCRGLWIDDGWMPLLEFCCVEFFRSRGEALDALEARLMELRNEN